MGPVGIDALLCASAAHFYFAAEANSISVFTDVWLPAMTIPVSWPGNVYLLAGARRECLRENRSPASFIAFCTSTCDLRSFRAATITACARSATGGREGITNLALGMPITIRFNPPLTEV